jgi:hypothetical protein
MKKSPPKGAAIINRTLSSRKKKVGHVTMCVLLFAQPLITAQKVLFPTSSKRASEQTSNDGCTT